MKIIKIFYDFKHPKGNLIYTPIKNAIRLARVIIVMS